MYVAFVCCQCVHCNVKLNCSLILGLKTVYGNGKEVGISNSLFPKNFKDMSLLYFFAILVTVSFKGTVCSASL